MDWREEQEYREYKQRSSEFISRLRRVTAEGFMRGLTAEQIKESNKLLFDCLDDIIKISEEPKAEPKLKLV